MFILTILIGHSIINQTKCEALGVTQIYTRNFTYFTSFDLDLTTIHFKE